MRDSAAPTNPHPPLASVRRDPFLARPRRVAAVVLTALQAGWLFGFVAVLRTGAPLDPPLVLLGIVGFLVIVSRIGLVTELAMAWNDRRHRITAAPPGREIALRAWIGVVGPCLLLAIGLLAHANGWLVLLAVGAVAASDVMFRVGGFSNWRPAVEPTVLEALLNGQLEAAAEHLRAHPVADERLREGSFLAVSGVAIRRRKPAVHSVLLEALARDAGPGDVAPLVAVVRADQARLLDPELAPEVEARALAMIPVGHPRRLALALFVATAALDRGDPGSAIKALGLLTSRDVLPSAGRVLVNWLLREAARRAGDEALATRCDAMLRLYNLKYEARALEISPPDDGDGLDGYTRWLRRARDWMAAGGRE
jgi:xanthosine utilization system XapX-like protein